MTSHTESILGATHSLADRVTALHTVLVKMQNHEIDFDPVAVRHIAAFAGRLPAADGEGALGGDCAIETCDAMLGVLLAGLTKGSTQALALADKHNLAYQRSGSSGTATRRPSSKPPFMRGGAGGTSGGN